MKRRFVFSAMVCLLAALAVAPVSAYYHFVYYLSSGTARAKFDLTALPNKTVWFFVSEAGPATFGPNDSFESVIGQIRQAAQVWNGVSTSDLRIGFGGFEHGDTPQNTPAADVVFEDLAPGLLGFGGPTTTATPVVPDTGAPWVPIVRSAIHINRNGLIAPFPSYSESFFLVLVHEMGHALGLQHTFTSAAMSTATTSATSQADPIDVDDIAGISVLYPNVAFARSGSISGRITSGGSPVHMESVVAIRAGFGAVSALTNPDGTYEIDGVPPGTYNIYAHALPPDADIQGPWYSDGTVAPASGPTNTLFYPGTTDISSATQISVRAGTLTGSINIDLTSIPTLPVYDVSVYGYFNNFSVAVKPAYLNQLAGPTTVVASGVGLGSNGQAPGLSAQFMGNAVSIGTGGVRPYASAGYTYIALDVGYPVPASPGPQHLILNTPGFMHVLPTAVRLTEQNPPTLDSVTTNPDGTLTIAGTNWASGSAIYFNGLPASISSLNLDAAANGSAIVTPPAGVAGQTEVLTVYNPDGQNSQFVQSATPATYTYPAAPVATIVSISPASLPAGSEATVTITGSNFHFAPGQTVAGFGSSDVVVRQMFVIDANHLQLNVGVAPGAALSNPDVSVFSGFQMATAVAGFQVTPAIGGLPSPYPIMVNAWPGLNGIYPGAIVSLYGANLAIPNVAPVVTFNGEAAAILYSSPNQINLQVPGDLVPGLTTFQLFNGALNGYVQTINIDTLPATITAIQNSSGNAISGSLAANQGDLLTVSLTGFAPDGTTIAPGRVQVSVNGVSHSVITVAQSASGTYQVSFQLNPDESTGNAQALIVYLDGRSSYPATIPVVASSAVVVAAARRGN